MTRGVRGRNAAREGSTSADMKRGRAEGPHPGRRKTSPCRDTRSRTELRFLSRTEGAREADRPKRARANSNAHPERSKRREPRGPVEAPKPHDAARGLITGSRRSNPREVRVRGKLDRGAMESASTADKMWLPRRRLG